MIKKYKSSFFVPPSEINIWVILGLFLVSLIFWNRFLRLRLPRTLDQFSSYWVALFLLIALASFFWTRKKLFFPALTPGGPLHRWTQRPWVSWCLWVLSFWVLVPSFLGFLKMILGFYPAVRTNLNALNKGQKKRDLLVSISFFFYAGTLKTPRFGISVLSSQKPEKFLGFPGFLSWVLWGSFSVWRKFQDFSMFGGSETLVFFLLFLLLFHLPSILCWIFTLLHSHFYNPPYVPGKNFTMPS